MNLGEYEIDSLSFDAPEIDSDSIAEVADLLAEIPLSSNQITFRTEASFCDLVNLFDDDSRVTSAIQFTVPEVYGYKQARTHRKRRINKKWLKRYGYKEIIRDMLYKGEIANKIVTTEDLGMPFMMDVDMELTNIQRIGWCDI